MDTQQSAIAIVAPASQELAAVQALLHECAPLRDPLLARALLEATDYGWGHWTAQLRRHCTEQQLHDTLPSWLISSLRYAMRTELVLLNYEIDGAVGVLLGEGLNPHCRLTRLVLLYNRLGCSGVRGISRGLRHAPAIVELDLGANGVGNDGACALAEALRPPSTLESVSLVMNVIGDAGAERLAWGLSGNTSLIWLRLAGNCIGPRGEEALKSAFAVVPRTSEGLSLRDHFNGQTSEPKFALGPREPRRRAGGPPSRRRQP